ncbi:MAG: class I SAM-dependent methyltransferase, partial [Alicyclobacillus sp.]|nr:class I SAM-dependent methyltransferase [Alicyclobacillus sp.]
GLKAGLRPLVLLYLCIAVNDLLRSMQFYRNVEEITLVTGEHPYPSDCMEILVLMALAHGAIRFQEAGDRRVLQITRLGRLRVIQARDLLNRTGYIDRRMRTAHLYHFDQAEAWDALSTQVWESFIGIRRNYLDWLHIPQDAKVLEVACGTGAVTFDAGLHARIPHGHLTALDIAADMLAKATEKWKALGEPVNVQFVQASVTNMPLAEGAFDLVTGTAFLHLVAEPALAVAEMARCATAGGTVSVMQAVEFNWEEVPFFREWFEPITRLDRRWGVPNWSSALPTAATLETWFMSAGLANVARTWVSSALLFDDPARAVQHVLRSVTWFRTRMLEIPWDHRRFLIDELIQRGWDVCRKYPLAQRIIHLPVLMIRGEKAR